MRLLQIAKESVALIFRIKPWNKQLVISKTNAILLRESLERLGAIFIKLGQMLALRPDFLPSVYCDELYKLLDQVPPISSEEVTKVLESELGSKQSLLIDFDPTPIASASFAQVHKAKLNNGTVIAVKIQRPNLDQIITRDLSIIKFFAKIFDLVFNPVNKITKIVDEFEIWTREELDYVLEATNIQKFNELSVLVADGIRGPEVYKDLTTSKILIMEFIDGVSLTKIVSLLRNDQVDQVNELGFNGMESVNKLIRNMLEMSHIHGFFHADPHPANIIFTPEKELVMVDFGIVGTLTKKERILLLRFLRTLLAGSVDDSLEALLDLAENKKLENIPQVKIKYQVLIDKFIATFQSKTYLEQQVKSGPVFADILRLMQSNGIEMPVSIIRYFKTFETVEGLIFALYPELQIQDMLKEFRRVSIINLVDAIPTKIDETTLNTYFLKLINSLEKSLLN